MVIQPYFCYAYSMSEPNFEWDEAKNQENAEKHGVSFYEAQHAFLEKNVFLQKITITARMNFAIIVSV